MATIDSVSTTEVTVVDPPSPKRPKLDSNTDQPIVVQSPATEVTSSPITEQSPTEVQPDAASSGDATAAETTGDDTAPTLSKRARKKAAKLAEWQVKKIDKRLREREKYRQRRADAVARGDPPTGPSRKALKHNTMAASPNKQRIAVDLDFDGLMIDKDVCKCAKQLLWVYTINRKAGQPAQLFYTGLCEGSRVQQALDKNDGYRNWDINIRPESYETVFDRDRVVYLTSDSDTVLERLDATDVYVIGGLVDHNHHKGLTLARATERGLRTARLPLGEHVQLKTRTVLTIVHVFDILLRVSEGQSWQDAILGVLPSRKGAIAKNVDGDDADEADDPIAEHAEGIVDGEEADQVDEPIVDKVKENDNGKESELADEPIVDKVEDIVNREEAKQVDEPIVNKVEEILATKNDK